jgi:tetratricopeptide (TPR) repeat protein
MIGRISYRQGSYLEAIEYLDRVPSDDGWAALTLGWCYDAIGDRGRAIEAYERTLRLRTQLSIARAAQRGLETPHSPTKKVKRNADMNDVEVSTVGWKAVAAPNPEDAAKAFDRNPKTRWASMAPQMPGMTYQIDLGSTRVVNRVVLNDDADGTTIYVSDYPREYTIEVSGDGEQWKVVASEVGDLDSYAGAFFDPTEARYIKITQRGSTLVEWWSIYEVFVYSPGPVLNR